MTDARVDRLGLQRRLLFAIAFRDVFVPAAAEVYLRLPLSVTVPSRGWTGWPGSDGSWRFSETGVAKSTGTVSVSVSAPGGEYVFYDPIEVTLPVPVSGPPRRSDFLVVRPLWPTRKLGIPVGESAVVGVISKAGKPQAGLRVLLYPDSAPTAATVEARTDALGEFVYRFPLARNAAPGGTLTLNIRAFAGAAQVPVAPSAFTFVRGTLHTQHFLRL